MGQKLVFKDCAVCGKNKRESDFLKRKKNGKESLRAECKDCTNERRRYLYETKNREVILGRNKLWIEKNKEYKKEYDKKREVKIKEVRNKQKLDYHHNKKTDPIYRLKKSLRARLYFALVNNSKAGGTIEMIGCSIEYLKSYLENKFKPLS